MKFILITLLSLIAITQAELITIVVKDSKSGDLISDANIKGKIKPKRFRKSHKVETIEFDITTDSNGKVEIDAEELLKKNFFDCVVKKGGYITKNYSNTIGNNQQVITIGLIPIDKNNPFQEESRKREFPNFDHKISLSGGIVLGHGERSEPYESPFFTGFGLGVKLKYQYRVSENYLYYLCYDYGEINKSEFFDTHAHTKINMIKVGISREIDTKTESFKLYFNNHIGMGFSSTKWEYEESLLSDNIYKATDNYRGLIIGSGFESQNRVRDHLFFLMRVGLEYNIPLSAERVDRNFENLNHRYYEIKEKYGLYFNLGVGFGYNF